MADEAAHIGPSSGRRRILGRGPSVPGCVTQSDSLEVLLENVREAVVSCLSVNVRDISISDADQIIEITV